jgi:hypothetical protein
MKGQRVGTQDPHPPKGVETISKNPGQNYRTKPGEQHAKPVLVNGKPKHALPHGRELPSGSSVIKKKK